MRIRTRTETYERLIAILINLFCATYSVIKGFCHVIQSFRATKNLHPSPNPLVDCAHYIPRSQPVAPKVLQHAVYFQRHTVGARGAARIDPGEEAREPRLWFLFLFMSGLLTSPPPPYMSTIHLYVFVCLPALSRTIPYSNLQGSIRPHWSKTPAVHRCPSKYIFSSS